MSSTTHQQECNAKSVLYLALELSARHWQLAMAVGPDERRFRRRVAAGDRSGIERAVDAAKRYFGLSCEVQVRSCHEAGRDGFWPHRFLTSMGFESVIVDSSSIEVKRRRKSPKTDRIDADKLVRMLWRYWQGERKVWHVVHAPTVEQEDERHASRALTSRQEDRTRYRNRIHSLLATHGVQGLRLDGCFEERLAQAVDWQGEPLPALVQARVLSEWRLLQAVEEERERLQQTESKRMQKAETRGMHMAKGLNRLRGVGVRSAVILGDELFTRDLRNRREVGGLLGYVSVPHDSGDQHIDTGISHAGVHAVRRIAVDLAWGWLRYQPESVLTQWYNARFARGGPVQRRIGIVAMARRLVIALWRYVTAGVVPAGAVLKTA